MSKAKRAGTRAGTTAQARRVPARRVAGERASYDRPEIPLRELRNSISRVLADVGRGRSFRVTVRGRPVAEIVPIAGRKTWVPWAEVQEIFRRAPVDYGKFRADIDRAVDNTVEDPWKRWKRS